MRRAATLAALALLTVVGAVPSSALAAGSGLGTAPARRAFTPELTLTASGYRVNVTGLNGSVALTVVRAHRKHSVTATAYVARGTAKARVLRASFGRLGRVSMRFRPSTRAARLAPDGRCHGPGTRLVRRGVFVGTLRFRGEGGYVSLDAHRVKGTISRVARRCFKRRHRHHRRAVAARPSPVTQTGAQIHYLAASWKSAVAGEDFVALREKTKALFIASADSAEGRVSTFRIALGIDPARDFRLDDALTSATVSPTAPFGGTGAYAAAPDGGTSWEGSLTVNFPGEPRRTLTDPPLETRVGVIPAIFAFALLRDVRAGRAPFAAIAEQPSLLAAADRGLRPR